MTELAFEAEDAIDFHVVNEIRRLGAEDAIDFHLVNEIHLLGAEDAVDFHLVNELCQLRAREDTPDAFWRTTPELPFKAEEEADLHVVDALPCWGSEEDTHNEEFRQRAHPEGFLTFDKDMQKVIEKIEFIKKEMAMMKEEGEDVRKTIQSRIFVPAGGSSAAPSGKSVMVGFDKHVDKILDVLTRDKSRLHILPIVGTGGIGKTTLAKHIFHHPLINHRFDIHLWVTISQTYSVQRIIRGLLNEEKNEENSESVDQLGNRLYKRLFGRRYLIVLDDVWTTEVWDDLKMFFPDNGDGSWTIMTTRLFNVGDYVGSHNPYLISFLNNNESWILLCQIIFSQEMCPHPNLENIGKDIAKSCRGLPLLINVIGGLLANSDMKEEYWMFIAQNVNALGNSESDDHCFRSLYLSYDNLPIHLKPCFLYMRVYLEDAEIDVSELIRLWIAEGFINSASDKTLEEIAGEHIKDLIDRNLLFVRQRTIQGEIETCGIHDLLRYLCLKESAKECFISSPKVQHRVYSPYPKACFLCCGRSINEELIYVQRYDHLSSSASEVCVFLCDECKKLYPRDMSQKLLKVMNIDYHNFVQPSGVRYTSILSALHLNFVFPLTLHLLWNLQTLKLHAHGNIPVLPPEIWEMPQLRHVDTKGIYLAYPKVRLLERGCFIILKNLQTLSMIHNFLCMKDIIDRIPNIKELRICSFELNSLRDLAQLPKLELLFLVNGWENITIPNSLKRLHLSNCKFSWDNMTIISSLPNLEELHLHRSGEGIEWNPEIFGNLKLLVIAACQVVSWRADQDCFPKLEWLILRDMKDFEIPIDVGCMDTLRGIDLHRCGKRVIESAKNIWEQHQDMSNENLQILVIDHPQWRELLVDGSQLEEPKTFDRILKAYEVKIRL